MSVQFIVFAKFHNILKCLKCFVAFLRETQEQILIWLVFCFGLIGMGTFSAISKNKRKSCSLGGGVAVVEK